MSAATWSDLGIDTGGRTSGQIKRFCPKCHADRKHRSERELSVNLDDGLYYCHHCGWKGTVNEARKPWAAPIKTFQRPTPPPSTQLTKQAQDFLVSRGINLAVALEAGVYTHTDDHGKAVALAFPYQRDGQTVHIKYRGLTDKRFWSTADTEPVFYGLDWCADADTVTICEGELDALALRTAGITAVLSVPNGAPQEGKPAGKKLDCMASAEAIFERATRIVIATDGDGPGQTLADEITHRLTDKGKLARIVWPDGAKDANDVLLRDGADALRQAVESAPYLPVRGIIKPSDLLADLLDVYDHGTFAGYETGYRDFDAIYKVMPGNVTVVVGVSGHGKSTALDQILVRLAMAEDFRTAIFSPEQQPLWRHKRTLMEQFIGKYVPTGPQNRPAGCATREDIISASPWLTDHFTFIAPDEPTIGAILGLAKLTIMRDGVKGLVIDPWNTLMHEDYRTSETEYVRKAFGQIVRFARDTGIHIWLVAHPKKLESTKPGSKPAVPTLNDVSGSAHFQNMTDMGLVVWRDKLDPQNRVYISTDKVRNVGEDGNYGCVAFSFNPTNKRYREIGAVTSQPTSQERSSDYGDPWN